MSRINHFASAAIVLGLLLTACRSEGEGGGVSSRRATNTPIATTISPEELAKRSAESAGYSMKALAIKDPATPAAGFEVPKESRLVAVQVELSVVSTEEKMAVETTYANIADSNDVTYDGQTAAIADELKTSEIGKGEKATGWIAFLVPSDAKLKSITYRIGLISTIALTAELPK
ncbi:MAG: DUF4352 domain-containing protein [Chloroflexi bacterium]|nr:DUF4352 domain-containing protein [Chloroflexota bacterium]